MEDKDHFNLDSQYHGCWWPGDTRGQGISRHVIEYWPVCIGISQLQQQKGQDAVTENWFFLNVTSSKTQSLIQLYDSWKTSHLPFDPTSAGPVYIRDPNLIITMSADDLAPNGARSSAGTVMTKNQTCLKSFFGINDFEYAFVSQMTLKISEERLTRYYRTWRDKSQISCLERHETTNLTLTAVKHATFAKNDRSLHMDMDRMIR